MKYDHSYVGQELNQMLNHGKPMAAFCRAVSDDIDEFSGQNFSKYVRSGQIFKDVFYIRSSVGLLIYTVYTLPEERWRFFLFKSLKKHSVKSWSKDQEYIESYLLGYIK